jgi:hypothetical protein
MRSIVIPKLDQTVVLSIEKVGLALRGIKTKTIQLELDDCQVSYSEATRYPHLSTMELLSLTKPEYQWDLGDYSGLIQSLLTELPNMDWVHFKTGIPENLETGWNSAIWTSHSVNGRILDPIRTDLKISAPRMSYVLTLTAELIQRIKTFKCDQMAVLGAEKGISFKNSSTDQFLLLMPVVLRDDCKDQAERKFNINP